MTNGTTSGVNAGGSSFKGTGISTTSPVSTIDEQKKLVKPIISPTQVSQPETIKATSEAPFVKIGVTKYTSSQKFGLDPVTGQYRPISIGSKTGVEYKDLPQTAKIALEQKGIVSSQEAPPSGAAYSYGGIVPSGKEGEFTSRFIVKKPITDMNGIDTYNVKGSGEFVTPTVTHEVKQAVQAVPKAQEAAVILATPQQFQKYPISAAPALTGVTEKKQKNLFTGTAIEKAASETTKPVVGVQAKGFEPSVEVSIIQPTQIADVKATRTTETTSTGKKINVVRFVGVDAEGKAVPLPSPKYSEGLSQKEKNAIAKIPKLPSKYEVAVALPDKETEVNKAITEGYAQHVADTKQLEGVQPLSKAEYTSLVKSDLEKQYEANIQSFIENPEIKADIIKNLRLSKQTIESNIDTISSPQYQLQRSTEYYARKGGEAEKIYENLEDYQKAYLKSPLAGFEQFGTIGSEAKAKEVAVKTIAQDLAARRFYGEKIPSDIEQYGETLLSAYTGGIYQPRPESVTARRAAGSPAVVIPSAVGAGYVGGALFTAAPTLATGAARIAGAGVSTATKIGTGVRAGQAVLGIGGAGLIGMKAYELETKTIPELEAAGATPEQITGLRAEFYGRTAAAAGGAILGARMTQSYLSEQVKPYELRPKGFAKIVEEPSGKIRGQAIYEYTEPTTRAMQISRIPAKAHTLTFDIKDSRLILSTPRESIGLSKTTTTKPLESQKELVTRNIDLEKARIEYLAEQPTPYGTSYKFAAKRATSRPLISQEIGELTDIGRIETPSTIVKQFAFKSAAKVGEPKTVGQVGTLAKISKIEAKPEVTPVTILPKPPTPSTEGITIPAAGEKIVGLPSFLLRPKTPLQITQAERLSAIQTGLGIEKSAVEAAGKLSAIERAAYDKVYGITGTEIGEAGGAIGGLITKPSISGREETTLISRIGGLPSVTSDLKPRQIAGVRIKEVPIQPPTPPTPPITKGRAITEQELVSIQTTIPAVTTTTIEQVATRLATPTTPRITQSPIARPPPIPAIGLPFGARPSGEERPRRKAARKLRREFFPEEAPKKKKKIYGILSEGISKELFGKATVGKTKFTVGTAPTAELEKAGITSIGKFFERGGFVTEKFGKGFKLGSTRLKL
jgi:hypothetical protein